MKFAVVAFIAMLAQPARAETDLAGQTRQAGESIERAGALLENARSSDEQLLALATAITAFENGLQVLRDGIRAASVREQKISRDHASNRDDYSRILGTLYAMENQSAPLLFLHPDGPVAAAQAAQLLAEATPVLRAKAEGLAVQITELQALGSMRNAAAADLRNGLAGLILARAALDDALAQGDQVPELFVDDRMKIQILAATSASLADFATELDALPLPEFASQPMFDTGNIFDLPVSGRLETAFNVAAAAGLRRPGITVKSVPLALVTTPFDATIRFAGPFLDYGNVIILEPQAGTLLVLAGMSRLFRAEGDVLTKGDPIGQLGGTEMTDEEFLIEASGETGVQLQQTLYIELRKDGESVDPAPWFELD